MCRRGLQDESKCEHGCGEAQGGGRGAKPGSKGGELPSSQQLMSMEHPWVISAPWSPCLISLEGEKHLIESEEEHGDKLSFPGTHRQDSLQTT